MIKSIKLNVLELVMGILGKDFQIVVYKLEWSTNK